MYQWKVCYPPVRTSYVDFTYFFTFLYYLDRHFFRGSILDKRTEENEKNEKIIFLITDVDKFKFINSKMKDCNIDAGNKTSEPFDKFVLVFQMNLVQDVCLHLRKC